MSDELLVRHCAPTLAGLKTGNLFSCGYGDKSEVVEGVRALNGVLLKKGICVLPLRYDSGRALIYVYRLARLQRDLASPLARRLLAERGYACGDARKCLLLLMRRLRAGGEFPHEIGLFLGYPPEDVEGFIVNAAHGCKAAGIWKVYGDVERAETLFALYRKCSRVYSEQWEKGRSIERLAVAG